MIQIHESTPRRNNHASNNHQNRFLNTPDIAGGEIPVESRGKRPMEERTNTNTHKMIMSFHLYHYTTVDSSAFAPWISFYNRIDNWLIFSYPWKFPYFSMKWKMWRSISSRIYHLCVCPLWAGKNDPRTEAAPAWDQSWMVHRDYRASPIGRDPLLCVSCVGSPHWESIQGIKSHRFFNRRAWCLSRGGRQ
jgi:hypothetical protein